MPLDKALYRELVRRALAEDMGWGDARPKAPSTTGSADTAACSPSRSVIAGLDVAEEVFLQLDPTSTMVRHHEDGDLCVRTLVAEVTGRARALLTPSGPR